MHIVDFENPEATASFVVPEGTEYLWLTVMAVQRVFWSRSSSTEFQLYEFKLNGTDVCREGVNVQDLSVLEFDALKAAIARATGVEELEELLGAALEVLALEAATQAQIDAAASALIVAIFELEGIVSPVVLDTPQATTYTAAQGNLARATNLWTQATNYAFTDPRITASLTGTAAGNYGADLQYGAEIRFSHVRHLFNTREGHDVMVSRIVDGNAGGLAWNAERNYMDTNSDHTIIQGTTNTPVNVGSYLMNNRPYWTNTNPRDRHFITIEWPQLMEISATRVMWNATDAIAARNKAVFQGQNVPRPETYVEYLDFDGNWVRLDTMVNELGQGTGRLGVRASAANSNNLWNGVYFDTILTQGFRINTGRPHHIGLSGSIGIRQWEVFGVLHVCSIEGYRIADYNNFVWKLFCADCGEYYADEAMPFTAFNGTSPNQLNPLLANGNVRLTTLGSGGYGIASGVTLVVPEGRILFVDSILNVRRDATLRIEGKVVVREGGRLNSDGHNLLNGGNIIIGENGVLVNEGYTEIASRSVLTNNGLITNNGTTGNFGRFEVRADVTFTQGEVDGTRALTMHRNVIIK